MEINEYNPVEEFQLKLDEIEKTAYESRDDALTDVFRALAECVATDMIRNLVSDLMKDEKFKDRLDKIGSKEHDVEAGQKKDKDE